MNNKYDEIINRLRQINPTPESDKKLTDSILHNIEEISNKENRFIKLNVSDKQWSVINGLRFLLTSAAVFLIGYLIFQQWETNKKLETLQEIMVTNPNRSNYNFNELAKNEKIQKVFNDLQITNAMLTEGNPQIEKLLIERKSLNYLLNVIRELKTENENFREKLRKKHESNNSSKN